MHHDTASAIAAIGNRSCSQRVNLTFQFSITDPAALWRAAAQRCMNGTGLSPEDVFETLGPPEDPSVEDCLAMLLSAPLIPGCAIEDMAIEAAEDDLLPLAGEAPIPAPRLPIEAMSGLFDPRLQPNPSAA